VNVRVQQFVVAVAIVLFILKLIAYYLTQSVAILTDALESTVNVIAGFISLYSLSVAAKPKDEDHPYGHGKAEFLSAAVEGSMIVLAGFIIIYEAINNLIHPHEITKLDYGIFLVAVSGIINFGVGLFSVSKGKKNNSMALVAGGRHLQSDAYSTIGLLVGLGLIYYLHLQWIDSAVAIIFSFIIIFTGYRILRSSVAGIMDEADRDLLVKMISHINSNRSENWIDLHNLRVIKYGGVLHLDCHLTVPWYINVKEAHSEIEKLSQIIRTQFGESLEIFVHSDPCLDFSCSICTKKECTERMRPFERKVPWTWDNTVQDKKHQL